MCVCGPLNHYIFLVWKIGWSNPNAVATEISKFSGKQGPLSWVKGSVVMSVRLVVQLGMFALAVTVASLMVLGPLSFNSSPNQYDH